MIQLQYRVRVLVRMSMVLVILASLYTGCKKSEADHNTITNQEPIEEVLEVGFARVNITPPIGMRLCGTFEENLSTGVHDSLYVRAIVFRQADTQLVIAGCDLAMVSPELCNQVRKNVQHLGLANNNVLIHASETHNGPDYFGEFRDVFHQRAIKEIGHDPAEPIDYSAFLVNQITKAITQASKKVEPGAIHYSEGSASGLAFYRRYKMKDGSIGWNPGKMNPEIVEPNGPTDTSVPVLSIVKESQQQPAAILTSFAMHLAVLTDNLYSADYPYYLTRKLQENISPELFVHFLQPPCNEVNHIDVLNKAPQTGYEWAQVVGERLAKTVTEVIASPTEPLTASLKSNAANINLEVQQFSEKEIASHRDIWYHSDRTTVPFLELVHASKVTGIADRHHSRPIKALIQTFQLSPETVVVGLPSEVSVELGLEIKKRSPYPNTLLIQLSNDWIGYIPPKRIFEEGNYEAVVAKIKPGEGERMVGVGLDMLNKLISKN